MTGAERAALLSLQDLDTAIDRHRHRRRSLPERTQLAELDSRLRSAAEARAEVAGRAEVIAARQQQLEGELAGAEARIADIGRRLSSGQGGAGRDVAALTQSVDHLRSRVSDLEDQVLEAMEERAPLEEQLAAVDAEVARLDDQRQVTAALVEQQETAIDAELAGLAEDRTTAAGAVPAERMEAYERLRARLGGVAVARLVGSRCDGCHLTLPATELDRIRRLPEEADLYCDQCGRMLIRA